MFEEKGMHAEDHGASEVIAREKEVWEGGRVRGTLASLRLAPAD